MFEKYRQAGAVVKLVPMRAGKGIVFAVVSDPNYEVRPLFIIGNSRNIVAQFAHFLPLLKSRHKCLFCQIYYENTKARLI